MRRTRRGPNVSTAGSPLLAWCGFRIVSSVPGEGHREVEMILAPVLIGHGHIDVHEACCLERDEHRDGIPRRRAAGPAGYLVEHPMIVSEAKCVVLELELDER